MCGIAGVFWNDHRPETAGAIVDRMTGAIRHRGPDSDGRSSTEFAEVGFKRLAIIDLAGGTQPLSNESATVDVFLNGEIYNFQTLRAELLQRGHVLRTHSDTEVLPHLYEDFGPDMFLRLNGMFSICVVDHARRQLLVARDHFGVKQMYYAVAGHAVIFGSELKAVLAADLFEARIDRASILPYLALFYCPEPHTLVQGVKKLPPGSFLKLAAGREPQISQYYQLPLSQEEGRCSEAEAVEQTRHLLRQAVKLQLQADVPVGVSLSGGVDSSAIACAAASADVSGRRPLALTISWPDTSPLEQRCAAELCRAHGLEHTVLQPPLTNPLNQLPLLAWTSDEPVADPATYSQLCVSAAARERVTVLLSGAGGDELFAGYGRYFPSWKARLFSRLPPVAQRGLYALGVGRRIEQPELRALVAMRPSRLEWHCHAMNCLASEQREALQRNLPESRDAYEGFRRHFGRHAAFDAVNQQMVCDLLTYLPEQVLPMLDRTTMASSIEGRVPFLDVPLVEFAFTLPSLLKTGWPASPKRLLKRAVADWVPKSILDRPKLGMPSPFTSLIVRERERLVRGVLLRDGSLARSIFKVDWLRQLVATTEQTQRNVYLLYGLLLLEVWNLLFLREKNYHRPSVSTFELVGMSAAACG